MRACLPILFVIWPLIGMAETTVSSGPERVSLVELYTSEGCSSCPPADESLSQLVNAEGLWRDFVPVALHVTYWDHLGWEDRFARSRFDRRQQQYANQWGHGVVYTPGYAIDGREWRAVNARRGLEAKARDGAKQGRLRGRIADGEVTFDYRGGPQRPLKAHVAVLGFDLTTEVANGENANRTLHHDFVALDYAQVDLDGADGPRKATVSLDLQAGSVDRRAIAVWVSGRDNPNPVQAAGGWLP